MINWCTPVETFTTKYKKIIDNQKLYYEQEDKLLFAVFLVNLIDVAQRSAEEAEVQFSEKKINRHPETEFETILKKYNDIFLFRQEYPFFSTNIRKETNSRFIIYEKFYKATGTFSCSKDDYILDFTDCSFSHAKDFVDELWAFYTCLARKPTCL